MKPTAWQVAEARARAELLMKHDNLRTVSPDLVRDLFKVFLAATEPPTDEELAQEASRYARDTYSNGPYVASQAYIAGANREGRNA
jgi:N-acyl-L-homoserine lactone synthetase